MMRSRCLNKLVREMRNYRIESAVLLEAFLEKSRLRFGEPEFLPAIGAIVVFIASSGGDSLDLDLLAPDLPLSLHADVGEGRGGAVLPVEVGGVTIVEYSSGIGFFQDQIVGLAGEAEGQ